MILACSHINSRTRELGFTSHLLNQMNNDIDFFQQNLVAQTGFEIGTFQLPPCIILYNGVLTPREEIAFTAQPKFNPNPKFLGMTKAYFVCHIGTNFQIH